MRRSGLLAFVGLVLALVVSACSFGSSPGGTAASPAADSAGSGRPAATLASADSGSSSLISTGVGR